MNVMRKMLIWLVIWYHTSSNAEIEFDTWMKLINVSINDGLDITFDHDIKNDVAAQFVCLVVVVVVVILIITAAIIRRTNTNIIKTKLNDGPVIQNCDKLEGGNGLEWGGAGKVGVEGISKCQTTWGQDEFGIEIDWTGLL